MAGPHDRCSPPNSNPEVVMDPTILLGTLVIMLFLGLTDRFVRRT
jgi:hypothetical protein